MAGPKGGKPVRISIRIWVLFWTIGFMGVLFALLSFSHVVERSGQAEAFSSYRGAFVKSKRKASPFDINCKEEVGVARMREYIPVEQQYHRRRLSSNSEDPHQQTCRSKYQQHCYWKLNYTPAPSFLLALRTYEDHHRKCIEGKSLTELALKGSAPSGCQYLVWRDLDGKGNQLISLVSAFVYALLTDRVLLITRGAEIHNLLCEPFHGSSWVLPEDFPDNSIREGAETHGVFYDRALNSSTMGRLVDVDMPKHLEAFLAEWQKPADLKFFCEGEQKLVRGIPWVFFRSNQYSVPGMYFVPSFRTKLNTWFPDRAVFLHAGRYLLSPEEQIWTRIMRVYKSHMAAADRRLAIQVRAWGNSYTPIISAHILACSIYASVLPNISRNPSASRLPDPSDHRSRHRDYLHKERISVVLTSLRREYAEKLAEAFDEGDAMVGTRVRVFSPSAEGEQRTGLLLHERKVIADMWLLSFADDMISTPKSTFGYVAHGLAGIKPIVLNHFGVDKESVPNPPCWRMNLPGPCFIDHPENMECPLDGPNATIGDGSATLPEVRHCELQWGVGVFEGDDEKLFQSERSQ